MPDLDRHATRLRALLDAAEAGRDVALVTVIATDGSTPARVGSCALVGADGSLVGTVGGGLLEAEALQRARQALGTGRASILKFDLRGAGADAEAPVCGGSVTLLIDPTPARARAAWRLAAETLSERRRGLWLIRVAGTDPVEVESSFLAEAAIGACTGGPGAAALQDCLTGETPRLFSSAGPGDAAAARWFVDPVVPAPLLVIVGGGHVGQAVAAQACLVGFDLVVLEDRPEFARTSLFPAGTRIVCGPVADALAGFPLGPGVYVVLVTRGHRHDAEALAVCVRRRPTYLGMIGSRRKLALLRQEFLARGWADAEEWGRVYAPIGLDIGAVTVPEIATSVVAQLIAVRRRGAAPRILPGDPLEP